MQQAAQAPHIALGTIIEEGSSLRCVPFLQTGAASNLVWIGLLRRWCLEFDRNIKVDQFNNICTGRDQNIIWL